MNIFQELGINDKRNRINEEVIYNIARSYTLLDMMASRFFATYNLSPAKFNILLMVKHVGKNNGIAQHDISKLLLVTTSNMTRMIDKLEKDNLVQRIAKKGDRRVNLIRITDKGSDLLDKVWPYYIQQVDSLMGKALTNEEKKILNNLLQTIKNKAKKKLNI